MKLTNGQKESIKKWKAKNPEKVKAINKKWRDTHKEQCKKYRQNYYQDNKNKILKSAGDYYKKNQEKMTKKNKEWAENNKNKIEKYKKKWRTENPKKIKAHTLTTKYIKIPANKLCEVCKINKAIHKHHEDYNKPLKVMFLCPKCHKKQHRVLERYRD